jgi:hypothetical protein
MLRIGLRAEDSAMLLIAHSAIGNVLFHIGDNQTAILHLTEAWSLYDEKMAPLQNVIDWERGY